jgi:hypothetical protein
MSNIVPYGKDETTGLPGYVKSGDSVVDESGGAVGGGGTDATAIHDNVANEITDITLKGVPVAADEMLIEDSVAGYVKKSITLGSMASALGSLNALHTNVNAEISAVTLKGTPVAADEILIEDSNASYAKKSVTLGSLFASISGKVLQIKALALTGASSTTNAVPQDGTAPITTEMAYGGQVSITPKAPGSSKIMVLAFGNVGANGTLEVFLGIYKNSVTAAKVFGGNINFNANTTAQVSVGYFETSTSGLQYWRVYWGGHTTAAKYWNRSASVVTGSQQGFLVVVEYTP